MENTYSLSEQTPLNYIVNTILFLKSDSDPFVT